MEVTWETARAWETLNNSNKNKFEEPTWKWDCNFKLDFDGPIVSVSSRFYPPHKNDHDGWEGVLNIYLLGKNIKVLNFKTPDLDTLKRKVEDAIKNFANDLEGKL